MKISKYLIHPILSIAISPLSATQHETPQTIEQVVRENHSLLSYDQILYLFEQIENGELENQCSLEQLDQINDFLVLLAKKGILPGEDISVLEEDVEALQVSGNCFGYSDREEVVLCRSWVKKQWDETRKFVKKHKKALIIGAVAAVTTVAVLYAIAAATAAAAAAASSGSDHKEKNKPKDSNPQPHTHSDTITILVAAEESSQVKESLEEHLSTFKETLIEEIILDPLPKEHAEAVFSERARQLGAYIAHDALDGVAEIVSILPVLEQELIEVGEKVFPEAMQLMQKDSKTSPVENFQNLVQSGHDKIDELFSFEPGTIYRSVPKRFLIGELPPPGTLPKLSTVRKAIQGEQLAASAHKVAPLEVLAPAEKKVVGTFQNSIEKKVWNDSLKTHDLADIHLKPYRGQYLPETQIRELIHQTGIPTFPRPAGIPSNYRVKLSKKSAGIKYVDPTNEETYIRIMPGKPHSQNVHQQKPYACQMINGESFDKYGKVVLRDSPEAHIPLEEFIVREK